jgi:hypothetical protein
MAEKRMLILTAELVQKIDENRGDLNRAEFIETLLNDQFKEETKSSNSYATKEELLALETDLKTLFKNFIEFFVNYGLEFGKNSRELKEITSKLGVLDVDVDSEMEKKATIRWK